MPCDYVWSFIVHTVHTQRYKHYTTVVVVLGVLETTDRYWKAISLT